ncbi:hypothetical protein OUZ56_032171 [Daphnia magna]|uniref:Uncharacterized protein n=1 Tax=Daphnia magna TaxID=35525 RepID=A0ABQ9ZWC5_9CRUS|nr:hypothetical protein OUZ56_032171 [Daphnia magna]
MTTVFVPHAVNSAAEKGPQRYKKQQAANRNANPSRLAAYVSGVQCASCFLDLRRKANCSKDFSSGTRHIVVQVRWVPMGVCYKRILTPYMPYMQQPITVQLCSDIFPDCLDQADTSLYPPSPMLVVIFTSN